jgi:hypothetical protein
LVDGEKPLMQAFSLKNFLNSKKELALRNGLFWLKGGNAVSIEYIFI